MNFADLSHHQDTVDMAAYAGAGHDRIALKATEGTGYLDPTFMARWRRAGSAGLHRIAYHYLRNQFSGADQFRWFLARVRDAGPIGPRDTLCLDTEDTATPGPARSCSAAFTQAAVAAGVGVGLVYTGKWYADPHQLGADTFPPGWRQLWLSDYTAGQPDAAIELPAGWARSQVMARQFTDRATVAGIPVSCDYSRVLRDWITTTPPTIPPPAPRQDIEMRVVRRTDGMAFLLAANRLQVISGAQMSALDAAGVPVSPDPLTNAQLDAIGTALAPDPADHADLAKVLAEIKAQVDMIVAAQRGGTITYTAGGNVTLTPSSPG